ncbi:Transcriptional regulator NanR [Pseudovibrio sp. Ad46]|uniref:GntR family transcriptional regulator n=1 Tax=unclassified Pseudovibrio TaxID=2627060 RepID=UPI0007AE78AB|nr:MULTISPECIES: GntR family transcriptional regulator [unclassified Pseudovibrio]KZK92988.1 Transcriptional regulator NanR [Pseudovibrio sp. Ad46]KZK95185.1 Transcriptional regulator NanR [Pseudovibrio sp. Ad5]
MEETLRPVSLSDLATAKLREAIMKGVFKLGEALSEQKLAEYLNISKTPIRHALAQMRVEGLVEVFPQHGTFVFTLSGLDNVELTEHRVILERAALQLAYERNKVELVKRLSAIREEMVPAKEKDDISRYLQLDIEFHRVMFDLCKNRYLIKGYSLIEAKIAAIRTHLGKDVIQTDKSFEEHGAMVEALARDDIAAALDTLGFHIGRYIRTFDKGVSDISSL